MAEYTGLESLVNIYFLPSVEGSNSSRFPIDISIVLLSEEAVAIVIGEILASSITETRNNGVVVLFLSLSRDIGATSCLLQVNARLRPILTSMEHRSYMIKQGGSVKSVSIMIFILIFSTFSSLVSSDSPYIDDSHIVEIIDPEVIQVLPHNSSAFTQGLLFHNGKIYESTGLYGESSLRIINTSTGLVEKMIRLSDDYFAEGLAIVNNTLVQLTWKENIGFLYNSSSLELLGNFTYEGEGWGLCNNQNNLWFSDGSYQLSKISLENFSFFDEPLTIQYNNSPINMINELECPFNSGLIYANIWLEDRIISISESTGEVCFEYDLTNIRSQFENDNSRELNGIAYDSTNSLFWITGKNWSNYYLVDLNGTSQDCQLIEQLDENGISSNIEIILIIILGIFIMPFSWPLFGLIFYKLFRRQTQHTPPSGTIENVHEE